MHIIILMMGRAAVPPTHGTAAPYEFVARRAALGLLLPPVFLPLFSVLKRDTSTIREMEGGGDPTRAMMTTLSTTTPSTTTLMITRTRNKMARKRTMTRASS